MSSARKRVFICCSSYPPETGGAPGRIYNLAQLLRSAGYAVTVFTSLPNYPRGKIFDGYKGRFTRTEMLDDIEVRRLWLIPSNASGLLARGLSLITQCIGILGGAARRLVFGKADLVYISSPPLLTSCLYALLARMGGKKLLVNISDIWPLTATELGVLRGGPVLRILYRLERRLYKAATGISGQSEAILAHVSGIQAVDAVTPFFLYRNLPASMPLLPQNPSEPRRRIVYAGALGFAQGLLAICRNINFAKAGITLDIYGDGVERAAIEAIIAADPQCGIIYHSSVSAHEMQQLLIHYDAMLIPLRSPIRGAVPSKLFTAIYAGLPVLYCGGGEGEDLVKRFHLGWYSAPADFSALANNLQQLAASDEAQLSHIRQEILVAGQHYFNKPEQDAAFLQFISRLL